MPDPPKPTWRRWFQFRLSTWLVLVGLVAWGITEWPRDPWVDIVATTPYTNELPPETFRDLDWYYVSELRPGLWTHHLMRKRSDGNLRWPALALVAFIGWKAFWLMRERRRNRSAPHC